MTVYRLGLIITAVIAAVLVTIGVFVLLVELDFAVHVRGRIEPARLLSVVCPEPGTITVCAGTGPVKKGDLLLALDTQAEERILGSLSRVRVLLRKQLENERELRRAAGKAHASEVARVESEVKLLHEQLEAERGSLAELATEITQARREQKQLVQALRHSELSVMKALRVDGLVTEKELELAKHRAEISRAEAQEAELAAEEEQIEKALRKQELAGTLSSRQKELALLKEEPSNRRSLLELERRLADLAQREEEIRLLIGRKRVVAPFNGSVIQTEAAPGMYVRGGVPLLTLAATDEFVFRTLTTPRVRVGLEEGLPARLVLDEYPATAYGYTPAKLTRIEALLGAENGEQAAYRLTLSVHPEQREAADKPYELLAGLSGTADIITFHGTTARYLMQRD